MNSFFIMSVSVPDSKWVSLNCSDEILGDVSQFLGGGGTIIQSTLVLVFMEWGFRTN